MQGDLVDCLVFAEPTALVADGRLYLALLCATGPGVGKDRIVLLYENGAAWNFAGTLLENQRDAQYLNGGDDFSGFSAPDLVNLSGRKLLIATPTLPGRFPEYRGCFVFEIVDLARAQLLRDASAPRLLAVSNGPAGQHTGACTYLDVPGLQAGMWQGLVFPRQIDRFRVYRTEVRL